MYTDASIEVSATNTNLDISDNSFGIICRYTNNDNYYYLVITSDGFYDIGKNVNGVVDSIINPGGSMQQLNINLDPTNHLVAVCNGSTLTLSVNNNLLASVTDSSLTSGWVGLIASSYDYEDVIIRFNDISVAKP